MAEIYLDNSATTKPYLEVTTKIVKILTEVYGNPSSYHRLGQESRSMIELARQLIAKSLSVKNDEIYFTSGGTESDNLAIKGACLANSKRGNRIVTTVAEHPAVIKTIRDLKRQGWEVEYVSAPRGELDLEELDAAINERTVLVSAMLVNNELGCIFPIEKIKQIIARKNSPALLHCDAVQGYGKMDFTAASIGADLISISAHKIHGPKGIGALYVRNGVNMFSLNLGGGQENGLRSGTESTPLIAGFGEAVRLTFENRFEDQLHMLKLRDYCIKALLAGIPDVVINSSKFGAPHIVNFSLPGIPNREVVEYLSTRDIFISSAAACKGNRSRGPSMLESLGLTRELADSALRVSFSYMNSIQEVDLLVEALVDFCQGK
ncbi:cysteine desulfurase family protein [Bacillus marasmi]|uniref:cysteine desulfurase family protein n=1 Tax=Bacillus marasmi TaxID=1926279 RepID=UPI0011CA2720|nr:cysteine desulfurase family protein [Bacillus marasmi]